MNHAETFAPLELADLISPKHIWDSAPKRMWDRALFEHLADRFDYILSLSEKPNHSWEATLWYNPACKHPEALGVAGELAAPGWTWEDQSLATASALIQAAAAVLKSKATRHVVIFRPGPVWFARVKAFRTSPPLLAGGAA